MRKTSGEMFSTDAREIRKMNRVGARVENRVGDRVRDRVENRVRGRYTGE